MGPDNIADLSIGSRDACLLLLRERLFGSRLVNNAVCPECAGRIEWEQDIADIVVGTADFPAIDQYFTATGRLRSSFPPAQQQRHVRD